MSNTLPLTSDDIENIVDNFQNEINPKIQNKTRKPVFHFLLLPVLIILSAWLFPSANVMGLEHTSVTSQADTLMEVEAGTSDASIIDLLMAGAMVGEGTSYDDLTHTGRYIITSTTA